MNESTQQLVRVPEARKVPPGEISLPRHPRKIAAILWTTTLGLLLLSSFASAQTTKRTGDGGGTSTRLTVSDASIAEGNEDAPTMLRFKVNVSQRARDREQPGSAFPVTVNYRVIDRSACCMNGDYQAITGQLTIPARTASTEIPVMVYGDKVPEHDESVELIIDSATNAFVVDGVARGTIVNDDFETNGGGSGEPKRQPVGIDNSQGQGKIEPGEGPSYGGSPAFFVADNFVMEGKEGTSVLLFNVRLSHLSSDPITLTYHLKDLTASSIDGDFQTGSATVTIPANRASSVIAVTVFGDALQESDETFTLVVDQVVNGQSVGSIATATGTITNDDSDVAGGGSGGPKRQPTDPTFNLASSNPVRGLPSFQFALARSSHVTIAIYDMAGRMIGTPVEGDFAAGTHFQKWNQSPPAPGIYLARLRTDDQTRTERISWLQ